MSLKQELIDQQARFWVLMAGVCGRHRESVPRGPSFPPPCSGRKEGSCLPRLKDRVLSRLLSVF
jgi:hypothetical protein